ncbi:hypothetical protein QAD02_024059 [Eretmocerus hayati]|uniref:Uncharacterized protein n=1 Tax=Eretmocerus hayati TaxID=131215 RepID=A0ACC2Q061_9HYME|nr:hypothetical protein QAD02_024059 [Eretmocerus hayati]
MALALDMSTDHEYNPFEWRMNTECLEEVLAELEEDEIISLLFLMSDEDTNYATISRILCMDVEKRSKEISKLDNWCIKVLESLLIMKNFDALRKLGFSKNDIVEFKSRIKIRNHSQSLNKVIEKLFSLCDNLTRKETEILVNEVKSKLDHPMEISKNNGPLELFVLYWIHQSYITITPQDNPNLKNLLVDLRKLGYGRIFRDCFEFDAWKNNQLQDSELVQDSIDNQIPMKSPWLKDHKKLCIIINELDFDHEQHERRDGSDTDTQNLKGTFKGLGFHVKIMKNCRGIHFLEFLRSFNKPESMYADYKAIFICILSHGKKGRVIFTDNIEIPIDFIRDQFCCTRLQEVFKFIILQSCQGPVQGLRLVTDGPPASPEPSLGEKLQASNYYHFGIFSSTISGFKSMRHKKDGTWFIQDLCSTLKFETPLTVKELAMRVKQKVKERRFPILQEDLRGKCEGIQVPSMDCDTMLYDYPFLKYDPSKCVK